MEICQEFKINLLDQKTTHKNKKQTPHTTEQYKQNEYTVIIQETICLDKATILCNTSHATHLGEIQQNSTIKLDGLCNAKRSRTS